MQMCPECDKVYDPSEYTHCPNCDGIMYWDDCWECTNCGEEIETDEDDNDGYIC